jgi:hypothetical protein
MELINFLKTYPADYTYFAVGSCPHTWGNNLTPQLDQLLPTFFQEQVQQSSKSFRAIHIDPAFSLYAQDLQAYFLEREFEELEMKPISPCLQFWKSKTSNLEIILLAEKFHHPEKESPGNDEWILEAICESIVQNETMEQFLVVQEFTGEETVTLFKRLYSSSKDQQKFKRQILFDVSYGIATGCSTDMIKYKPFTSEKGSFYNLLLTEPAHLSNLIGKDAQMDSIIQRILIQNYKMILNSYHVDYRRRLRGDTVLFQRPDYTNSTSPDEIMNLLLQKLSPLIQLLLPLQYISHDKYSEFQRLSTSYYEYDVYKWYEEVNKLVPVMPYSQ